MMTLRKKNAAQCKFRCRACGDSFEYSELIKQYAKVKNEVVTNVPPWIEHTEPPFVDCPNCDEPTFNFFERHCINCDYRDTLECKFCGSQIDQLELPTYFETGHCCHCDYVLNKKD